MSQTYLRWGFLAASIWAICCNMHSVQASEPFQISRRNPVQELRPVQGKTKKRYEAWWIAFYRDGTQHIYWDKAPQTEQNIVKVLKYENDLEKSTFWFPGGAGAVLLNPQVVTYEIPAYWTGKSWMTEPEMLKQAKESHKKYLRLAQMEHRLVERVLDMMRNKQRIIEEHYKILELQLDLQQATGAKKAALQKQIRFKTDLLNRLKQNVAKTHTLTPIYISRCRRVDEEVDYLIKSKKASLAAIDKARTRLPSLSAEQQNRVYLDLNRGDKMILLLDETVEKLRQLELQLKQKQVLLPY